MQLNSKLDVQFSFTELSSLHENLAYLADLQHTISYRCYENSLEEQFVSHLKVINIAQNVDEMSRNTTKWGKISFSSVRLISLT